MFIKLDIWGFFKKRSRKFKFHYTVTRITGTLHEHVFTFMILSRRSFIEWENFHTINVEKIKTRILYSINVFFPRKSCRLWNNVEKYCRSGRATDDNMRLRMGIAYWIPEVTDNAIKLCNTYCFFTPKMVKRTRFRIMFIRTLPDLLKNV
jgi:hypothetical protein